MADLIIKDALGTGKTFETLEVGGKLIAKSHLVDASGVAAVGEVADNPAANTVLGRLKAIATALAGVLSVKKANRTLTFAFKTVPAEGSGVQLCAADSTRTYLFVENTGIGDAVIAPGTSAPEIDAGKPLNAAEAANKQGGWIELDGASAQEWWAFSTPGTRILVITGV